MMQNCPIWTSAHVRSACSREIFATENLHVLFRHCDLVMWNLLYSLISNEYRGLSLRVSPMEFLNERVVHCLKTDPLARTREPRIGGTRAQTNPVSIPLLESIDEALTDLLGSRTREAVYDYLERNCSLARNEIPTRLDDFFKLLNETFGKGGSTIGKVIAKKLYAKLGWEFVEIQSYGLMDYVETARGRLEKEAKSSTRTDTSTFCE